MDVKVLMDASDYLTEMAQRFTSTGDVQFLNAYCRYSFSPVCHNNAKSVFVTRMENEKRAFLPVHHQLPEFTQTHVH